jgi:multicomponent Na+:H+ antiporter subunit E
MKERRSHLFLVNVLLALAWGALTGHYEPVNLLIGFVMGYVALWLIQRTSAGPVGYFNKGYLLVSFFVFFISELVKANVRVLYDVLTPWHRMQPGIVAIPLDVTSDAEITLLANLISLTPGTLSLDVSDDRRVLYVHTMYMSETEAFRSAIKDGLERRIREVFQ